MTAVGEQPAQVKPELPGDNPEVVQGYQLDNRAFYIPKAVQVKVSEGLVPTGAKEFNYHSYLVDVTGELGGVWAKHNEELEHGTVHKGTLYMVTDKGRTEQGAFHVFKKS